MKRVLCLFIAMLIFGIALWADPIEVWSQTDLNNVRNGLSGDYVQMADIHLTGEWTSISTFTGSYDGNGFYIYGLTPKSLFGTLYGATVQNVKFIDIDIYSSGVAIGSLAGRAVNSTIINCSTDGGLIDIFSYYSDVGGIVGILENSYMEQCYNTVRIRGNNRVGGLVGISKTGSHIYRCYNVGPVIDSDRVGGLVGLNEYGSKIEECYSANLVQGLDQVGGLVGINYGYILNSYKVCTSPVIGDYVGGLVGLNLRVQTFDYEGANAVNGVIENCYSNGIVSLDNNPEHPGGLVGFGGPGGPPNPGYSGGGAYYGIVINSYYDADITPGYFPWYWPYNDPSRHGYARTTDEMTWVTADNTYVDWDFVNIWKHDNATPRINRGYPTLEYVYFDYDCEPPDQGQPVELSSFTASVVSSGSVNLQWRAESETSVLGYNVFRSSSNNVNDAIKISYQVIIALNSSMPTNYSYLDEEVTSGTTYYYWLQSVDLDLSSAFHGPVSVTLTDTPDIPDPVYTTTLRPNYPNPFIPSTTISYSLRETTEMMELKIYNIMGQLVRTLHSGPHSLGEFDMIWDGKDNNDRNVPSGVYFYRMTTPNYDKINKMLLLK